MGAIATTAGNGGTPNSDPLASSKLDLYKLEYERAAIRYEDIYKAVWQIFSYMTAVSGALLAFGADHFQQNLYLFLSSSPLVYWFFGTYIPLDRYGNKVIGRLKAIENRLHDDYGVDLRHYRDFEARKKDYGLRVCYIVWPVFWLITSFWALQVRRTYSAHQAGIPLIRQKATEVKIVTIDTKELERLLEGRKEPTQGPSAPPKAGSTSNQRTN